MATSLAEKKLPQSVILRTIPVLPSHFAKTRNIDNLVCKPLSDRSLSCQFFMRASTCFPASDSSFSIRNPRTQSSATHREIVCFLSAAVLSEQRPLPFPRTCRNGAIVRLIESRTRYVPENTAKRTGVATQLRTWTSKNVDPDDMITIVILIDERLACLLALQHAFGLRVKESLELKPSYAVIENGAYLQIHEGTKGGKMRMIRLRSDQQRKVIEWAIRLSGSGKRMRWPDKSFKQSQNRFYNLCRKKLGINGKGLGVTCHGLRHDFADRGYTEQTGLATPLNGGSPANIDWQTHHYANVTMSHELGHIRTDIVASYYGTFGHALRKSGKGMPPAIPIY